MTSKMLKELYSINEKEIDIGYRHSKTLRYTRENCKTVIDIDKFNQYYIMTINGNVATTIFDKVLYWDTLEDAKADMINIFCGSTPIYCEIVKEN